MKPRLFLVTVYVGTVVVFVASHVNAPEHPSDFDNNFDGLCTGDKNEGLVSRAGDSSCRVKKQTMAGSFPTEVQFSNLRDTITDAIRTYQNQTTEKESNPGSECRIYHQRIEDDLKPFSSGITKQMLDKIRDRGVFYQVRQGKLYREPECRFPARCSGVEYFLKKVAEDLADTEFYVNVADWPQVPVWGDPFPLFSFSKTSEYRDVMYPAWTFWEGGPAISMYPRGLGRWDKMRNLLIQTANNVTWTSKRSQAFFRGSRTSEERDPLILLSRKHPELIDAKYTKNQAWKSKRDTLNEAPAEEVPLESHCQYKFLFNYRGVAASFRYKHLFLCRSVVFQVGSEWKEFFYDALIPWIHFIPVSTMATQDDLKNLLTFFRENDDLAEIIADNGFTFIKNNLKFKHIYCYWNELLNRYTTLLKFVPPVTTQRDLIEV